MQSQVRFNRVPEKVAEKVWEALKVPEKVRGSFFWCRAGQVQQGSEEGSGEGLGGFGAEPGQVQQGSGGFGAEPGQVQEGSGEDSREDSGKLWCRVRSGSTGFRRGSGEGSGEGLGGFGGK